MLMEPPLTSKAADKAATTAQTADAAIEVAGLIERDTVWSGNIAVNGKVQIQSGATLTIKPGANVRFAALGNRSDTSEDRIFVQKGGLMIAKGTDSQPILFSSVTPGMKWFGIELHSEHDKDSFVFCRLKGSRMGIACVNTSPLIENCSFDGNEKGVSMWRQSKPIIRHCRFQGNAVAIEVGMQSEPAIISSSIEDSVEIGVRVESGSGGTVSQSGFSGNKIGINKRGSGNLLLKENRFQANDIGIFTDHDGAVAEISGNFFTGNRQAVSAAAKAAPRLSGNTFEKNNIALRFDGRSKGTVDHNTLSSNVIGVHLSRTSNPELALNLFDSNETALLCEYSSYPVVINNNFNANGIDIRAGDNQSFEWTRGIWPVEEWESWAQNYGRNKILARHNYWGRESTGKLLAGSSNLDSIADYRQNPGILINGKSYRRDEVELHPFSQEPFMNAGSRGKPPSTPAAP